VRAARLVALGALVLPLAGCLMPMRGSRQGQGATGEPGGREVIRVVPNRPYSQAVRVGNTYYFAGKVGVTDSTRALASGRVSAEVRNIFEAFRQVFNDTGVSFRDVVQVTVYLADINDYDEMNRAYAEYFNVAPPARETVAVSGIVNGARVEISLIAVKTALPAMGVPR
jgi:2-iminobutanoate/2-iminopropanoate deaminase